MGRSPGVLAGTHGQGDRAAHALLVRRIPLIPRLIVRRYWLAGCGALAGWCRLVEAEPVGSRVNELHLSAIPGAWADARIEKRVSALMEFGVQRVDIAHYDEHGLVT
jgi:hypothetical protein